MFISKIDVAARRLIASVCGSLFRNLLCSGGVEERCKICVAIVDGNGRHRHKNATEKVVVKYGQFIDSFSSHDEQ